jgi:hypothetical protein
VVLRCPKAGDILALYGVPADNGDTANINDRLIIKEPLNDDCNDDDGDITDVDGEDEEGPFINEFVAVDKDVGECNERAFILSDTIGDRDAELLCVVIRLFPLPLLPLLPLSIPIA